MKCFLIASLMLMGTVEFANARAQKQSAHITRNAPAPLTKSGANPIQNPVNKYFYQDAVNGGCGGRLDCKLFDECTGTGTGSPCCRCNDDRPL